MEKLLLFVCTGNSCRSPMAEAWFNHLAAQDGQSSWRAVSAGLGAMPGGRASAAARSVMGELGLDLDGFTAQPVSRELVEAAALIVAVSAGHQARLAALFPAAAGKIRRLLEFDGGGDVADPFGGSVADYRNCFAAMRGAIENLYRDLQAKSGGR